MIPAGEQLRELCLAIQSEVRVNWVGFDSDLEVKKCEVVGVCEGSLLLVAREKGYREDACGMTIR